MKLCVLCASVVIFFSLSSCSTKQKADLIIHNAIIYTVDSAFSTAQSFAVKDGKFIAIGTNEAILSKYNAEETIDAEGKSVYPGIIDSHCHFYGYGEGLRHVNLVGTKSFDEVIDRIVKFSKENPDAKWIIGRGWDQNDWAVKEYPKRYMLDKLYPSTPVFIERIDGHAALANAEALRKAGITKATKINGGVIEIDLITEDKGNEYQWTEANESKELKKLQYPVSMPSGILIDNAVDLVKKNIPKPSKDDIKKSLLAAEKNCFEVGLTTVDDAGLEKNIIDAIDEFQKSGELKMRIYAMLSDNKENLDHYLKAGKYKTDRLNVRSFKFYGDGALGSRGACLLKPYSDKPEERGFLLSKPEHFDSAAVKMIDHGFQMNTHCIGDSAVKLMIDINGHFSIEGNSILRWRIEHAQVIDKKDFEYMRDFIPSVQPTHATSDMYWAEQRLGKERVKYAYAYNDLLKAAGMIALGTDFPVENINPMYTFYAAVARKDLKGFPEGGFQPENALSRENTLRGMTIWGAFANFEEKEKGSIEKGKFADFVILDQDIMKCNIDSVPKAKVVYTFVGGEKVFYHGGTENTKKHGDK
ncbi:MAG: amidohydrolase [Bacteroidetes bacterium]|nr:amidohydrolase [Bacteroidota bacterium]